MQKYKLTTQELTTHNGFPWEVGVPFETNGEGELCGPGWLHYYHSPLLAVLLNPIHGNYANPRLWEVEAEGIHLDDKGLKGGCTRMTLVQEVDLPTVTTTQRVAFGILCALEVHQKESFVSWATAWLDGTDRSADAAEAATWAAEAAAAEAAAWAAAWAAEAATWAAADAAAEAAAWAAEWAGSIDLIALAEKAMNY